MLPQRIHQTPYLPTRDKAQIARFINSIYYFIDIVYTLGKDGKFWLILKYKHRLIRDGRQAVFIRYQLNETKNGWGVGYPPATWLL